MAENCRLIHLRYRDTIHFSQYKVTAQDRTEVFQEKFIFCRTFKVAIDRFDVEIRYEGMRHAIYRFNDNYFSPLSATGVAMQGDSVAGCYGFYDHSWKYPTF